MGMLQNPNDGGKTLVERNIHDSYVISLLTAFPDFLDRQSRQDRLQLSKEEPHLEQALCFVNPAVQLRNLLLQHANLSGRKPK